MTPAPDSTALADPTFITPETEFAGATLVELPNPGDQVPMRLPGRIVAQHLPCSVDTNGGLPGCGAEATMTIVRMPVRGLNMPGEQLVGLIQHCTACGPGRLHLVTPTDQEIADGWAPGTVC